MDSFEARYPDDLKEAAQTAIKILKLVEARRIPPSIEGFMIRTTCMHLLRCLYGSNLETAAAIRKFVLEQEQKALDSEAKP